jgi:hypothetical protein
MGERAAILTARFERTNQEFMETIERFSDDQWGTLVPGENWTVGVVAHHIAASHELIGGWVKALASGQELRPATDEVTGINAEHARQYAACTREETLELARRNGEDAARLVRGLDDEQLDRRGFLGTQVFTTGEMVERVLIGHPQRHLANIRSTIS